MSCELSICIPTLNRAGFIGETLDSIVSQLEAGVEIVIVDGGSTDGSAQVVAMYCARFPQIHYVRMGEGAKASNAGFDHDCSHAVQLASGTHCWLMTDDDVLKPGAVARVLAAVRAGHDLAIVSCEVRDQQLRRQLVASRPGFASDRVFSAGEWDDFFRAVVVHLTFVGAVVVRRSLWLERQPEEFFGSGFVHVGVLFRRPVPGTVIVLAEPLIVIRNGNGQWNARAFDIFMIRWPELLWSFEGVSEQAKRAVTPREPWRLLRVLLLQRAFGRYSIREYVALRERFGSPWRRAIARLIAGLPLRLLYWPARAYGSFKHADPRYFVETLREAMSFSPARTPLSREISMPRPSCAPIDRCRACGNTQLEQVLDLGEQMLTGVFPRTQDAQVTRGPLRLVKCTAEDGCGLLQLAHSYDLGEMYGDNYGYRSGLNASMVRHLGAKVARIRELVSLRPGDLVVDVGSNDGTTLGEYPESIGADLLGIDPTAAKFRQYYKPHVDLCADFFTAATLRKVRPGRQVRVLTSFSMFYDLESPMAFMRDVHDVLADDGVWVFEQSYMPAMLDALSYDTVCHEHLEYYALKQVKWMADRVGFTLIDIEFNDVNGGSFSVTAAKSTSGMPESPEVARVLAEERARGLDTLAPFEDFARRTAQSREGVRAFLAEARAQGKTVAALGASTKGNVLLQYCGITTDDVAEVGEVNPDKFGALTPGTFLPIRAETDVLAHGHDYHLVLPWHFRSHFLANPRYAGRALVFPLPELQVVRGGSESA